MKAFVIACKPSVALSPKASNYLTLCQRDIKWRFKSYKAGRQQGLGMVWDNMMKTLKSFHETKINA